MKYLQIRNHSFELGDTAGGIERRRRGREERQERGRQEQVREGERLERDRMEGTEQKEETEERTQKRPQKDTGTDVESIQSRQKQGEMKSIFPSDSDKEANVEFVK